MELTKFLKIFKENLAFIVIISLAVAAISTMSASFLPPLYSASRIYFVTGQSQKTSLNENYYSQENARNFTDTAVAVLQSTDFAAQVVKTGDSLTVRKLAPQLIKITISAKNPSDLNANITSIASNFNNKIAQLEGSPSSQLAPIGQIGKPTFFALNKPILFAFGLILGSALAIFIVGVKNYFRL